MRVLVVIVVIVIVVIWESKANSSSTCTELQTGTELGNIAGFERQTCFSCALRPPFKILNWWFQN